MVRQVGQPLSRFVPSLLTLQAAAEPVLPTQHSSGPSSAASELALELQLIKVCVSLGGLVQRSQLCLVSGQSYRRSGCQGCSQVPQEHEPATQQRAEDPKMRPAAQCQPHWHHEEVARSILPPALPFILPVLPEAGQSFPVLVYSHGRRKESVQSTVRLQLALASPLTWHGGRTHGPGVGLCTQRHPSPPTLQQGNRIHPAQLVQQLYANGLNLPSFPLRLCQV